MSLYSIESSIIVSTLYGCSKGCVTERCSRLLHDARIIQTKVDSNDCEWAQYNTSYSSVSLSLEMVREVLNQPFTLDHLPSSDDSHVSIQRLTMFYLTELLIKYLRSIISWSVHLNSQCDVHLIILIEHVVGESASVDQCSSHRHCFSNWPTDFVISDNQTIGKSLIHITFVD